MNKIPGFDGWLEQFDKIGELLSSENLDMSIEDRINKVQEIFSKVKDEILSMKDIPPIYSNEDFYRRLQELDFQNGSKFQDIARAVDGTKNRLVELVATINEDGSVLGEKKIVDFNLYNKDEIEEIVYDELINHCIVLTQKKLIAWK